MSTTLGAAAARSCCIRGSFRRGRSSRLVRRAGCPFNVLSAGAGNRGSSGSIGTQAALPAFIKDPTSISEPLRSILDRVWTVDISLIVDWLKTLDRDSREQVVAAIELLEAHGPQLGRPLVDTVRASRHRNMKELRPGSSGRSELRILFAFDPKRAAIMLVAGDKAGNWTRWYRKNIPLADDLFDEHLHRLKGE